MSCSASEFFMAGKEKLYLQVGNQVVAVLVRAARGLL